MSLFPAYGNGEASDSVPTLKLDTVFQDVSPVSDGAPLSPGRERSLLESDTDCDSDPLSPARPAPPAAEPEYYTDRRSDGGNLRVSTLYYPGRPDYPPCDRRPLLGAVSGRVRPRRPRAPRYWRHPAGNDTGREQALQLAAKYRAALHAAPADTALWMQYIQHQLTIGEHEAMQAALEGVAAAPHCPALTERCDALMRLALTPNAYVQRLQDMLHAERDSERRAALWTRMVSGAARAGDGAGVQAVCQAAVRDLPMAYPRILTAYGGYLRAAGRWEDNVLLIHLVSAMSFPPRGFPPPRDWAAEAEADRQLDQYELTTINSKLPLGEVWSRVERARAAVHWQPAGPASCSASDPQRSPLPPDMAELLIPLPLTQAPLLIVALLRMAEVPLLPVSEHCARTIEPTLTAHGWEADSGAGVLGVLRAARRVHALVSAARARRVLAVCGVRAQAAANGYGAWVSALWDAAQQWAAEGVPRSALACWRLRYLHARLIATDDRTTRTQIRDEARRVVQSAMQSAGGAGVGAVCAAGARAEGAAGGAARGLHAARAALRLAQARGTTEEQLYAARVVIELSASLGGAHSTGLWAAVCAVLQRPVPSDTAQPPSIELRDMALLQCEERCAALARTVPADTWPAQAVWAADTWPAQAVWAAMLPADSEWFAMRATLAPHARRAELLAELVHDVTSSSMATLRRREAAACALVSAACREHRAGLTARRLAPLFHHNAYINIVSGVAPLWAPPVPPVTDTAALCAALPAMLAADDDTPHQLVRLRRVVERCRGAGCGLGGGGALLAWGLRAHSALGPAATDAALHSALAAAPYSHALHVMGATLCPPLALTMPDLMLERSLRTHALPTELTPL